MATLELVEKLREKTNVSYEDAKAALDACKDDLLDAVIYLEKQGKITPPPAGGHFSSEYEKAREEQTQAAQGKTGPTAGENFQDMMRRLGKWLGRIFHKGNVNQFEVWKKDSRFLSVPVTVLVLLIFFCFWVTLPLLVIGLFAGFRYRFGGGRTWARPR